MQDVTEHTHSHTHAHTHTRMRASVDETSITGTTRVRRRRQFVKVTTSAAPKKHKGKQPYCLLRCTFTAPHFALLQRAPPKSEATQRTLHFYSALQCKSLCLAWLRPLTQPAHASGNWNHHAVMILTKHVHHAVRVWSWYHDTDKTRPSRCKSAIMISWYWLLMPSRCKSVSVFMLT